MNVAIFTDNDFDKINGVTTTFRAALQSAPSGIHLRVYTAAALPVETDNYLALRSIGLPIPFYSEVQVYLAGVSLGSVTRQNGEFVILNVPAGNYRIRAERQSRLASLALADRRIGASRSTTSIASFFRNGATVRGLVVDGRLAATGETLAEVQRRVLGGAVSAPMYTAVAGYAVFGLRAGFPTGRNSEVMLDFFNITDRNWRGIGWGVDADGRGVTVRWKIRLEPAP